MGAMLSMALVGREARFSLTTPRSRGIEPGTTVQVTKLTQRSMQTFACLVYSVDRKNQHFSSTAKKGGVIAGNPFAPPRNGAQKSAAVGNGSEKRNRRRAATSVDGARRIRTADLLGAIQALCQLSYSPEGVDGKLIPLPRKGKDNRIVFGSLRESQ